MRSATPTSASCSRQPARSSWLASSTSRPLLSVPALPWPAAPWHSLTVPRTPKRLPRRDRPVRNRSSPLLQGPAMTPCSRPRPRGAGSHQPASPPLLRRLNLRFQGRESICTAATRIVPGELMRSSLLRPLPACPAIPRASQCQDHELPANECQTQLPARNSLMNSRVVVLSIVLLVPPDRQVGWCRESSDYLILPDRMIK